MSNKRQEAVESAQIKNKKDYRDSCTKGGVSRCPLELSNNDEAILLENQGADAPKSGPKNVVPSESKRAAFRKAKRDAGIPTSQTHNTHLKNQNVTKSGGSLDSRDGTVYKFDGGKEIQLHPSGHKFKDGTTYDKAHFNNHNNGSSSTTNHYEF